MAVMSRLYADVDLVVAEALVRPWKPLDARLMPLVLPQPTSLRLTKGRDGQVRSKGQKVRSVHQVAATYARPPDREGGSVRPNLVRLL